MHVYGDPHAYAAGQDSTLRIATYNASLYDDAAGGLVRRLESGDDRARRIAAVLQRVRPDIVLLNEFDHDAAHRAADLFQHDYLERAQPGGGNPLRYPYRYLRSEEHTSELQSLMRISYAVFCLKKKNLYIRV